MNRIEAQSRIEIAAYILEREYGWTEREISNLIGGLHREDAVERIEDVVQQHARRQAA